MRLLGSGLTIILTALCVCVAPPAYSCGGCADSVDDTEAYALSMREGRDPVEGLWLVYLDWMPADGLSRKYRIAIVRNDFGVYPEASYLGVATCDSPGCRRGEVKLTLTGKGDGKFGAALKVTEGITAFGDAFLVADDERGRKNSLLDMNAVKYKGRPPTVAIIRIIGG